MKTIILATDFSPAALNAANYAAELATSIKGDLLLLHTYFLFESYSEVPSLITAGEIEQDAIKSMDELKKNLEEKYAELIIRTQVSRGTFINELNQTSDKIKPYCVVMGSQGASATDYRMFGSQTVQAMKKIHSPVIAVPTGTTFHYFKKIGIACDLENGVDHVPAEDIKRLTKDFNASIHILNSAGRRGQKSKIIEEASALVDELSPLPHEFHFISNEDDDKGIIDFTEKNNMDLLIVLPKKHTLFDKWTHASITQKIVLRLRVPVMALHFSEPEI